MKGLVCLGKSAHPAVIKQPANERINGNHTISQGMIIGLIAFSPERIAADRRINPRLLKLRPGRWGSVVYLRNQTGPLTTHSQTASLFPSHRVTNSLGCENTPVDHVPESILGPLGGGSRHPMGPHDSQRPPNFVRVSAPNVAGTHDGRDFPNPNHQLRQSRRSLFRLPNTVS